MKNVLVYRNLLFIFTIFLAISCKKSDEVTPALLTGKWKQNGVTGKLTVTDNGKSSTQDLTEPADNSITEFTVDGKVIIDGTTGKYTLSGTSLTIGEGTQAVTFTAKVSGNNLTLSWNKDQYFKYIESFGDTSDPDVQAFLQLKSKITALDVSINFIKQ
jgi:hypothetical protein